MRRALLQSDSRHYAEIRPRLKTDVCHVSRRSEDAQIFLEPWRGRDKRRRDAAVAEAKKQPKHLSDMPTRPRAYNST